MIGIIVGLALVVIGVSDGDTLIVKDGDTATTIRLAEIDAPERTQPYSQVSRRNLEALCRRATAVEITPVDTDRYGRTVAHVRCDGVHVNWRQVEDGLAWCFTKYLKQPETCLPLESAAREAKRGLWREANPQPPWEFRSAKREK
jgi:endonuclease YncB( thermonuclease family)